MLEDILLDKTLRINNKEIKTSYKSIIYKLKIDMKYYNNI